MNQYATIHTAYGLTRNAQAVATGTPIVLTEMALGDGNGNPVVLTGAETQLAREVYRAPVNRVFRDPDDAPGIYTAELAVPATVGGWVMREVGVFDDTGGLYLYGNLPNSYKPLEMDGAYSDGFVRVKFALANASIVTLQVNPNTAIASQAWVLNTITMARLLPGGTTGQMATKASNADGDIIWADPNLVGINVTVDIIEEVQTLAAGQTAVTLTTCTTSGLSLYIGQAVGGERLRPDQWTPDGTDHTKLTLAASYPAGTKLHAVQNDPQGDIPPPLLQQQNLADLANKATARANLGVYSRAEVDVLGFRPGMKAESYSPNPPPGFLACNGAAVSRVAYAALYAAIGTVYGAGDGVNTFNLPDERGNFSRAWDNGRGIDPGRVFGSEQTDAIKAHNHSGSAAAVADHSHALSVQDAGQHGHTASSNNAGAHGHTASTGASGDHTHAYKDRYLAETQDAINNAGGATYTEPTYDINTGVGSHSTDGDNTVFVYKPAVTDAAGTHTHTVTIAQVDSHAHVISVAQAGQHTHTATAAAAGGHSHAITIGNTGGSETRPRNRATLWCIKY